MRSQAFITVTCDIYRLYSEEVEIVEDYHRRPLLINAVLERYGWVIEGGDDICPTCYEERRGDQ
jgi:hypothetical protein